MKIIQFNVGIGLITMLCNDKVTKCSIKDINTLDFKLVNERELNKFHGNI